MFERIMVPVDLAHADRLGRALTVASSLARSHGSEVVYVGVTTGTPTSVAHSPEEYRGKLETFAGEAGTKGGHPARAHAIVSHDPSIDMDSKLVEAAEEIGADLVVMATHVPGIGDIFGPNHGGALARHARTSVFLVRGE